MRGGSGGHLKKKKREREIERKKPMYRYIQIPKIPPRLSDIATRPHSSLTLSGFWASGWDRAGTMEKGKVRRMEGKDGRRERVRDWHG